MRMPDVYMSLLLAFGVVGVKAEAVDFVQDGLTLSLDASACISSLKGGDGRELVDLARRAGTASCDFRLELSKRY